MSITAMLKELEMKLIPIVNDVMTSEVASRVAQEGADQVQIEVYDVYDPKMYQRSGELRTSWGAEQEFMGVTIYNTRQDRGEYLTPIIESGEGYTFSGYGYDYEQPRPFIQSTRNELFSSKEHVKVFRDGLRKRGVQADFK